MLILHRRVSCLARCAAPGPAPGPRSSTRPQVQHPAPGPAPGPRSSTRPPGKTQRHCCCVPPAASQNLPRLQRRVGCLAQCATPARHISLCHIGNPMCTANGTTASTSPHASSRACRLPCMVHCPTATCVKASHNSNHGHRYYNQWYVAPTCIYSDMSAAFRGALPQRGTPLSATSATTCVQPMVPQHPHKSTIYSGGLAALHGALPHRNMRQSQPQQQPRPLVPVLQPMVCRTHMQLQWRVGCLAWCTAPARHVSLWLFFTTSATPCVQPMVPQYPHNSAL
jgi:hypothetical protein